MQSLRHYRPMGSIARTTCASMRLAVELRARLLAPRGCEKDDHDVDRNRALSSIAAPAAQRVDSRPVVVHMEN